MNNLFFGLDVLVAKRYVQREKENAPVQIETF